MSRVIQDSGVQLLPDAKDPRAAWSSYFVSNLCSADLRTKSRVHRDLASRLRVVR